LPPLGQSGERWFLTGGTDAHIRRGNRPGRLHPVGARLRDQRPTRVFASVTGPPGSWPCCSRRVPGCCCRRASRPYPSWTTTIVRASPRQRLHGRTWGLPTARRSIRRSFLPPIMILGEQASDQGPAACRSALGQPV